MSTGKNHPGPRKTYKYDSPGAKRAAVGTTLTTIKKTIAMSTSKTSDRRAFKAKGFLGGAS